MTRTQRLELMEAVWFIVFVGAVFTASVWGISPRWEAILAVLFFVTGVGIYKLDERAQFRGREHATPKQKSETALD